mmetsp:Transcript_22826/g.39088  ORF Transcript_22826/g.39088 Transcript_22826/m.39088 type:complete len:90 (-) Transcript_22826:570-839(-)
MEGGFRHQYDYTCSKWCPHVRTGPWNMAVDAANTATTWNTLLRVRHRSCDVAPPQLFRVDGGSAYRPVLVHRWTPHRKASSQNVRMAAN